MGFSRHGALRLSVLLMSGAGLAALTCGAVLAADAPAKSDEMVIVGGNLTGGVKITDIGRAPYFAVYQAGDHETAARPRTIGGRIKVEF